MRDGVGDDEKHPRPADLSLWRETAEHQRRHAQGTTQPLPIQADVVAAGERIDDRRRALPVSHREPP